MFLNKNILLKCIFSLLIYLNLNITILLLCEFKKYNCAD